MEPKCWSSERAQVTIAVSVHCARDFRRESSEKDMDTSQHLPLTLPMSTVPSSVVKEAIVTAIKLKPPQLPSCLVSETRMDMDTGCPSR